MKYEVIISEGCRSFDTSINGKSWSTEYEPSRMAEREKEDFVNFLCEEFKRQLKENTVSIDDFIKIFQYDDYEMEDGACETCGDSVSETIWRF